jgi:hypothetical protein
LFLAAFLAQGAAQGAEKLPVPGEKAQEEAQQLVREVYTKEQDRAKTSAEKVELARKMLDQADETATDPATRFVLLRTARHLASEACDAETSLAAVDRMARVFDVDGPAMQEETLQALAEAARTSSQFQATAEQALPLVETAVQRDDYPRAVRLAELGVALARRAREWGLAKQIADRREEVQSMAAAYADVEEAQAVLQSEPTDPEANLVVGRYLCFNKGDWSRGIPMLALVGDKAVKSLAAAELEKPATPGEQVALADGWWDLAQAKTGADRDALLRHAGSWYRKARDGVSGLVRVKVDQRLAEIAKAGKVGKPQPVASAPARPHSNVPKGAVLVLTFEKDTFFRDGERVRVRDASGHGHHGVVHGGGPGPGRAGQGFLLAGTGHYIDCGNAEGLHPTDAVTVSAWVLGRRWTISKGNRNDIVSNDDWETGPAKGYVLRCDRQGRPDFNVGNRVWKGAMSNQAMLAGRWYHLAGTYDRNAVRLFVNGVQVASTESSMPIEPSSFPLLIGRGTYDTERRFDGIVDEVAVFDRALSDDEIETLYQLGLRGKPLAR